VYDYHLILSASSGAGAAAGALTPPENAPEHDDDKQCPNPKENCKDCGGNIGMCTTGQNSGCKSWVLSSLSAE